MDSAAAARILIVDDEPSLVRMMSTYLARFGYDITSFSSTDKAWEHARTNGAGFAVAVLDVTMPGLSSEELALNLLEADPEIRIVAASGYPFSIDSLWATAPERVIFLHKPFTPATLAETVRRMIPS